MMHGGGQQGRDVCHRRLDHVRTALCPQFHPTPAASGLSEGLGAAPTQLTAEQHAFFDTFGFLHLRGAMADSIAQLTADFEEVFASPPADGREDKEELTATTTNIEKFVDLSEPLSALLEHPFVDGVFRSLLGDDYVYLGSDGKLHGVGGTRQAQCHPANVSVSPSP